MSWLPRTGPPGRTDAWRSSSTATEPSSLAPAPASARQSGSPPRSSPSPGCDPGTASSRSSAPAPPSSSPTTSPASTSPCRRKHWPGSTRPATSPAGSRTTSSPAPTTPWAGCPPSSTCRRAGPASDDPLAQCARRRQTVLMGQYMLLLVGRGAQPQATDAETQDYNARWMEYMGGLARSGGLRAGAPFPAPGPVLQRGTLSDVAL